MPQFDFFTAFNQIVYGFFGLLMVYYLFVSKGPFYDKFIRVFRSASGKYFGRRRTTTDEWRDRIRNGVVPTWWENVAFVRDVPSYLEFFHAIFLARKLKLFLTTRHIVTLAYVIYFKSLSWFVNAVNWVFHFVKSLATVFLIFSKDLAFASIAVSNIFLAFNSHSVFLEYSRIRTPKRSFDWYYLKLWLVGF